MCGIVGYLGENIFTEYILTGLRLLINRGYDSVGITTIIEKSLNTIKTASDSHDSLDILEKKVIKNNYKTKIGIAHTRWATHGSKTEINAHPHNDTKDRISLVHNGIIENYNILKDELTKEGYLFRSETDTEVISIFIGKYLDEGNNMTEAIEKTIQKLSGTWALVIVNKDFPNKIWITRNGSPLLLGMEEKFIIIASEQIAFGNSIKKYIVLDNHDIIEISNENGKIIFNRDIYEKYTIKTKQDIGLIETKPIGYEHWMKKEINEQGECVIRAINNGGRIKSTSLVKLGGLDSHKKQLSKINHLILLGCGTSYHSGLWAVSLFKSLDIFETVQIYDGAEFSNRDIIINGKTAAILLSQSGETKDLHRCIDILNEKDILKIGIVNVVDSMIARETDCGIYLNAGREVAVASTKSFTNQSIVLTMVSIWFLQIRKKMLEKRKNFIKDLMNLSFQIKNLLNNREILSKINKIAEKWSNKKSMFILGKGKEEAIAKEGALKIKEVCYIHAEGYSSSALKHGPFALIEDGLPIIILDIGIENREKNQNAYNEVKCRNADILFITDDINISDNNNNNDNNIIKLESNHTFGGILSNIILQILSYELSLIKKINPDFPRNLAKVVTVE
jgi:glucosamine--fructose-6-phosphate aminotransferase (isomerizing)